MKYLTIILLFISFNLSAQTYVYDEHRNDKYKVLGMSLLETVTDATGDALMDSNRKELGHIMNATTIGLYVIEPALITYDSWADVGLKGLSLIGARLLVFNLTYNLVRGLPYDFVGTTSYYDQFVSKQPDKFRWGKGVIITFSFAITLKEWK